MKTRAHRRLLVESPPPLATDVLYRNLIEHMNEALWMGDEDERTLYVNPKFCELTGYTAKEVLGMKSYDFWDSESSKRVLHVNTHHRKKGMSSSYEGNLITKKGDTIPVLINGTPLPNGHTFGIITDVSELKQKAENEKILSRAVECATDAIVIFDEEGTIQSWNQGARAVFGYKHDETMGRKIDSVIGGIDLLSLTENPVFTHTELRVSRDTKHNIIVSAIITPIYTEAKKLAHWLLIARDISIQRKYEEQLASKFERSKEVYMELGIQQRRMDYLIELVDTAAEGDLKQFGDFVVSSLMMLARIDACVLRVYNAEKETLELVSFVGMNHDWSGKASIKFRNSLARRAFDNGAPLRILDVSQDPLYSSGSLARKSRMCSMLLIPLRHQNKIMGTLSLYTTPERKAEIFDDEFVEKYAKLIQIALAAGCKQL